MTADKILIDPQTDAEFRQMKPACTRCGCDKYTRFRYFNNKNAVLKRVAETGTSQKLQARFACRSPECLAKNPGKTEVEFTHEGETRGPYTKKRVLMPDKDFEAEDEETNNNTKKKKKRLSSSRRMVGSQAASSSSSSNSQQQQLYNHVYYHHPADQHQFYNPAAMARSSSSAASAAGYYQQFSYDGFGNYYTAMENTSTYDFHQTSPPSSLVMGFPLPNKFIFDDGQSSDQASLAAAVKYEGEQHHPLPQLLQPEAESVVVQGGSAPIAQLVDIRSQQLQPPQLEMWDNGEELLLKELEALLDEEDVDNSDGVLVHGDEGILKWLDSHDHGFTDDIQQCLQQQQHFTRLYEIQDQTTGSSDWKLEY